MANKANAEKSKPSRKTLQYILGHGNIATTMNNYVSAKPTDQQRIELNELAKNTLANS